MLTAAQRGCRDRDGVSLLVKPAKKIGLRSSLVSGQESRTLAHPLDVSGTLTARDSLNKQEPFVEPLAAQFQASPPP